VNREILNFRPIN